MLPKTMRPSSTAATMVAKLSSSSVMPAASLLTSVPAMPIAMPTSAFFSAGASLTPSPVIATTSPRFCQAVDDAQLVGRRHARVDGDVGHVALEIGVAHRLEVAAGDDAPVREHPELPGDGAGGQRMIAGDHHGADAGGLAGLHGGARLGPRRIHHRDEAEQRHPAFRRPRATRRLFVAIASTRRPSRGHALLDGADPLAIGSASAATSRPTRSWLVQPASTSSAAPFE